MEKIKIKHGIGTKLLPIISLFLNVVCVITCAFGVFGIGRPKDSAKNELERFLSKPYIQETMVAVLVVDMDFINPPVIKSITHLQNSTYFSVTCVINNNETYKYYDSETKRQIREEIWHNEVGNKLSYALFTGQNADTIMVTISGDDLNRVLREVRGE